MAHIFWIFSLLYPNKCEDVEGLPHLPKAQTINKESRMSEISLSYTIAYV